MQVVAVERVLCRLGHLRQLIAIKALIGNLMRDAQVGFGIDRALAL